MRTLTFVAACSWIRFAHASSEDTAGTRSITYFDANDLCAAAVGQRGVSFRAALRTSLDARLPVAGLTHVVLANAVRVDNQGALHFLPRPSLGCEDLVPDLARLLADSATPLKLIVSLRGYPDDVAFDELAEDDLRRQRFGAQLVQHLLGWGASGVELEWRAGDPAGGTSSSNALFDVPEQLHFGALCRDLGVALRAGASGRSGTLSVAVEPGRLEFSNGAVVRDHVDWLAIRANSSTLSEGTLTTQHAEALREWTEKGVPRRQLVLQFPTEEPYLVSGLARRLQAQRLSRSFAHIGHEGYGGVAFIGFGSAAAYDVSLDQVRPVPLKVGEDAVGSKTLAANRVVNSKDAAGNTTLAAKRMLNVAPSLFQRGVRLSRTVDDGLSQSREEI